MVEIRPLSNLPDVVAFTPRQFKDSRGYFMETFRQSWMATAGIEANFVQDNQSYSAVRGTLRGLHFQNAPQAQGKLVRCARGRVWDVAVDLRPGSQTYGLWAAMELTADGGEQLYIPPGFAHGFLTLTNDCLLCYKCTAYYHEASESSIHYADPDIAIDWPDLGIEFALSQKDLKGGSFKEYNELMATAQ